MKSVPHLPAFTTAVSAGVIGTGALNLPQIGAWLALIALPLFSVTAWTEGANLANKERSGLSKVFSASAAVTGTVGAIGTPLGAFAALGGVGNYGLAGLLIPITAFLIGATCGPLAWAAHGLQNKHVKVEDKKPEPPKP